jgi:16S rRNA C1402 (ribose-2'-O) methylase RsmI
MANQAISVAISQLKQEHIRLCKELARVDEALSALGNLDGADLATAKSSKKGKSVTVMAKRTISAAARKKMSEAARARWAARKKEKTPAK